jgi:copper chaperone CopZ
MPEVAQFTVTGGDTIHCAACEQRIANALRRLPGVADVHASHATQRVTVMFDPSQVSTEMIRARLAQAGFEAEPEGGTS